MEFRLPALVIFSFFAGCLSVFGQHLFVEKFSAQEYKAGQNVKIAQDAQGIIYISNNEGLLTFDGAEWGLIPLPNKESTYSIAIDSTDKIYVGYGGGLGYFQKDSLGSYIYHSLLPYLDEAYRDVGLIHEIAVFKGLVVFCDETHIYVYTNGQFKIMDVKTSPFKSIFLVGDRLYISSEDNKLYEYTDIGLEVIENDRDIQVWAITNYWNNTGLVLDNKNQLWLLDPDALPAYRWQPFEGIYKQQLNGEQIIGIKFIKEDQIALFTWDNILFMNENGEIFSKVSPDFLENYLYQEALLDANHNLWVVCPVNILLISTSSPLYYVDNHDGFKGQVISMAKKGDYEYIGTGWGIYYRKERSAFQVFTETYPGEAWNFYASGSRLLAGHRNGVFELNGDKATKIVDHRYVMSVCGLKKHDDTFIMGTYNTGLWLLRRHQDDWKKTKIKGFEEMARFMHEDTEGNIWISYRHSGVWKLRLNAQMDSVVSLAFYDKNDGLPSNINNRIYRLNSGKIVTATMNGVYSYNSERDLFEREEKINEALGENVCIYSLAETVDGDIYFWGVMPPGKETAGVLKKGGDGLYSLTTTPFGKIAGLTRENSTDVEAPLFIVGPEEVWIGNRERRLIYNPKQETFYEDRVSTHIKHVWAKDSLIFRNGQAPESHALPYNRNYLHFEFTSTFYESREKVEYQYRLDGFDDQWSAWDPSRKAVFTNLPEGDYIFSVRAKNVYEHIGEPAYFTFHVAPPWYRTVWAYLSYLLLGGVFVYSLVLIKTKRIQRQKKVLQNEVNEKTKELLAINEEIVAQNEEISAINEDVQRKNHEIAKQAEELKELNFTKDKIFSIVSHDLRGPVNQLRELFNMIKSGYLTNEEFKSLAPDLDEGIKGISNLTDNLLHWAKYQMNGIEAKKSRFNLKEIVDENVHLAKRQAQKKNIQLSNTVNDEQFVFADKDMIKLLLRNLISNAVKFTPENGTVTVTSQLQREFINISVIDTGVGISSEEIERILGKGFFTKYGTAGEKGSGIGLMLCREFSEKNGGTLTIESTPGQGSKFTFNIPVDLIA